VAIQNEMIRHGPPRISEDKNPRGDGTAWTATQGLVETGREMENAGEKGNFSEKTKPPFQGE